VDGIVRDLERAGFDADRARAVVAQRVSIEPDGQLSYQPLGRARDASGREMIPPRRVGPADLVSLMALAEIARELEAEQALADPALVAQKRAGDAHYRT
jgi:hypothetical protein